MLTVLNQSASVVGTFLADLRNKDLQQDPLRFRHNLERLGTICAYEVSKSLDYQLEDVPTPLGIAREQLARQAPVVATVLRAGLPFFQGFLKIFDRSPAAFIGAAREETLHQEGPPSVALSYLAMPAIENTPLIITDPMLATGNSLSQAIGQIKQKGAPSQLFVACVVAAPEGVQLLQKEHPEVQIVTAALDEKLDQNAYIVPGLGDAGDLAFGQKL